MGEFVAKVLLLLSATTSGSLVLDHFATTFSSFLFCLSCFALVISCSSSSVAFGVISGQCSIASLAFSNNIGECSRRGWGPPNKKISELIRILKITHQFFFLLAVDSPLPLTHLFHTFQCDYVNSKILPLGKVFILHQIWQQHTWYFPLLIRLTSPLSMVDK